ncbi:MAG: beta-N-acetylhexosaminidase [Gammaproteobacteria bacterium]|nr:beta-N-acetylhexosaminidase [Gammaproteobacteria bacterium]
MSLGPLMIDIEGTVLTPEDRELLRHPLVGGVILFSRNFVDRQQLTALTAGIHALRNPHLLVAVDHEGGRVQRFRSGFTVLPPAARLGEVFDAQGQAAAELVRDCGRLLAAELRAVGVDFSFAPVLDLGGRHSSVIGDRAFHKSPQAIATIAQWFVAGMHEGGMGAVAKHFPGHGSVREDSHHEMPVDPRPLDEILANDLLPFRLLCAAGIEGVMPAHVVYPEVAPQAAGFSPRWLQQILRDELGFRGAVFSDDISMAGASVAGGYPERAEAALAAGCDMVLVCNNRDAAAAVIGALRHEPQPLAGVRMMRLHGRRPPCNSYELEHDEYWQQLATRVAALNGTPELDLDDGQLA